MAFKGIGSFGGRAALYSRWCERCVRYQHGASAKNDAAEFSVVGRYGAILQRIGVCHERTVNLTFRGMKLLRNPFWVGVHAPRISAISAQLAVGSPGRPADRKCFEVKKMRSPIVPFPVIRFERN